MILIKRLKRWLNYEKKERLVTDEVNSNNEFINNNLEIMFKCRKLACEEINKLFESKQTDFIKFTMDPVVSSDILGARCGSLVDGLSTKVLDVDGKQLVKVVSWYDNEMSYTSQMIKTMKVLLNK